MKSHNKNPFFNNTYNQQNIQTLLSSNVPQLYEDQNENLKTIQKTDSATRQSQNELEERDSFDGSPNRKPELQSVESPANLRQ